jgi:hypothetical protein
MCRILKRLRSRETIGRKNFAWMAIATKLGSYEDGTVLKGLADGRVKGG